MDQINIQLLELKSNRDFRDHGSKLDRAIRLLKERECGTYRINREDKNLFLILENMKEVQKVFNKGVRIVGSFDTTMIEVYDLEEHYNEMDKALEDFNIVDWKNI